jgi:two-component system cell cycle response regulator
MEKKQTILVVEDHPLNMKLVRSLLDLAGYKVLEAENAQQAIQLTSNFQPDLILMDIQLPDMDGLEATRIIKSRKESEHIPVVALTSYAMPGDERKASEARCSGYITKPIDTRQFIQTIENYLEPGTTINPKPLTDPAPFPVSVAAKHRILIVDDDPLNIKLLKAKLPARKYDTLSALNGEQALLTAMNELPDLILLDIMMPGLDGFEVSRRLKANPYTKDIPIIVITALEGLDEKIRGLEAGADEFLNKPVNTIELLARIRSLLRLKQYRERLVLRTQTEKTISGFRSPDDSALPGKILVVEDNDKDRQMLLHYFKGQLYDLSWAQSGEEALDRLEKESYDLLLLDVLLPGLDGFEVCRRLKHLSRTRDLQIILITCLSHLENKIKGIELGADDYLIKPINSRELLARTKVLLQKKRCMDILQHNYETALNLSINDGLTGLYNRAYFNKYMEQEIKRATRQHYPLTLILLDIDDFKCFNDSLGHPEGDRILKDLGAVIKTSIREIDFSARYGGDEFVLVLPYVDPEESLQIAERLRSALSGLDASRGEEKTSKKITISMGMAFFPDQADSAKELIRKADLALYRAKGEGKNRIQIFQEK